MSEITRIAITQEHLLAAQSQQPSLENFFSYLRWEYTNHQISIPAPLKDLLFWKQIENLVFRMHRHKNLMIIAPFLAYFYGQSEGAIFWWLLFPVSIPICVMGIFVLWSIKTNLFVQKLSLLDNGFVALVGNILLENLPQYRFLQQEKRRLEHLYQQVSQKEQEGCIVYEKLQKKSQELQEDSNSLLQSIEEEIQQLRKAKRETEKMLQTIQAKLHDFEAQREKIYKRAELEYIRNQARALSQEEQTVFSQRALSELEVDALFLQQSIRDVEDELGRHGVHFTLENQLSR